MTIEEQVAVASEMEGVQVEGDSTIEEEVQH